MLIDGYVHELHLTSAFLLSTFGQTTQAISFPHHRKEKQDLGRLGQPFVKKKKKKQLSAAFPNVSALLQRGVIPGVSPGPETIAGLY